MDFSPSLATATSATRTDLFSTLRTLGWIGIVGGVLGALSAIAVLATPPMVTADQYSYPFDTTTYIAAQIFFAVQHLTLLAPVIGLAVLQRSDPSPLIRVGLWLSGLALLGFIGCEIFALTAASAPTDSAAAQAVNNVYGIPMIAIGIGFILVGIGVARRRLLSGASRWLPLVLGAYVFVVLFPAVFGPQVAGHLAIGAWMLLFAAVGLALVRVGREHRVVEKGHR